MSPASRLLVVACWLACSKAAAAPCNLFVGSSANRSAGSYATLGDAVSAATPGDTVCFRASKHPYPCSDTLVNKSLTITTEGEMGDSIIDCGGVTRFARLRSLSSSSSISVTIASLVLRHGRAAVGGLIHAERVALYLVNSTLASSTSQCQVFQQGTEGKFVASAACNQSLPLPFLPPVPFSSSSAPRALICGSTSAHLGEPN